MSSSYVEYSYTQNHWLPITLIQSLGLCASSSASASVNDGNDINSNAKQGIKVHTNSMYE